MICDKSFDNWKYIIDEDNKFRFLLGQIKNESKVCLWFGINPSTASPDKLDNTIKKIVKLSKNNGFDNWLMANIYPQRATNPNDLDNKLNTDIHETNMKIIESILDEYKDITIVFAYGNLIDKRKYLKNCLDDISCLINKSNISIKTLGLTNLRNPKHPLYLKDNTVLTTLN